MKPYIQHSYELFYRFFYITISFLMCFCICYINSTTVITFITYPYLKINLFKRLVALNLSEVFYTSVITCYLFTLFVWFPFVVYQVGAFFSNAWFKNQVNDFFVVNFYLWTWNLSGLLLCYYFITPVLCFFFLQWEIAKEHALLLLEIEPRITYYTKWVLPLFFLLANIFSMFFLFFFFLLIQINNKKTLIFLIKGRIPFLIIILFFLSLFSLDLNSLIILTSILFILYELFLFFCCLF